MFLLNRISKFPPKQSYSQIRFSLINKRSISQASDEKSEPDLLEKYESKLLFNSVIESRRLNFGYGKNSAIISMRNKEQEKMNVALKTVQPLPITLKYCTEFEENSEENTNIDSPKPVTSAKANFPFQANASVGAVIKPDEVENMSLKDEIAARKKLLDEKGNWMSHYENYEEDLIEEVGDETEINYGTPDPACPISDEPCGGCGAHLHCKDVSIPGYIPSEIFKNCFNPNGATLSSIFCQRCHFLKEYNIALQVRVSPDDYPKVLQSIPFQNNLAILMVDLTDFPCSIWPGIADILGPKTPIVLVGNKVDLLPKDDDKFLDRVRKVLLDNLKLNGFANSDLRHVELISAKTGFGVENLISALQRGWRGRGNLYLIGCTNVGKSSLFNLLLQSDLCKIQAADLIQRATTSPWPGTTLNLLKFPVARFSGHKQYVRRKRLEALAKLEKEQQKQNKEALRIHNTAKNATLIGTIERSSLTKQLPKYEAKDEFSTQGTSKMSDRTRLGIDENSPDFALGKWCFDTPGVVHPDQILHLLTIDELVKTLPKQIIRPETFCVRPGTSLFIAGLARLDFVQGPGFVRLTVFRSESLPITICQTSEAASTYSELLGSDLLQVPIIQPDRQWPGLELAKNFKVSGKNDKESSYDVVLSSAGWIAINCGLQNYEFDAWTPEKRGVHVRDSLLPKAVQLRGARIRDSVAYKRHKFIS